MASVFNSYPNSTAPTLNKVTAYGRGHWKIAAYDDSTSGTKTLIYSTDRKTWHTLHSATSPVVLYSTNLWVNSTDSDGCVVSLPPEILPQYARPRELKENKQEQIDAKAPPISQSDYFEGLI